MIVQDHFYCDLGRLVLCDFTISDIEWRAIGIYIPNADAERERFFAMIKQHLCVQKQIVLLGDFNCVLSAKRRSTKRSVHDGSVAMLKQLLDEFELEDVTEWIEAGRGVRLATC